ncbi:MULTISPECIES: DUF3089 domain-containing protein [unclassified Polaribacter]|jgi:hypothetical protein|uniref:DUF3089 domain-containing protein n=1 Tax=unclassified Polaribacter TaxID=196858 RepID=UPI00052BDE17|nr:MULTISPECIES: DUF3089 domain-containing protein [unclassified Polaribacter]KGL59268.1 hypothetical protein PHEL49_0121 [Polaribacter sp. Hel1_33_49]MBT4413706.1 DUF3089 domain-containing protein [Polaribacter sp.]
MVKKIFFLAFFIVLVGCKSTHKIQGFSKKDIPSKPNYNNEKNWAVLPNSSFEELKEFTSKEIDTLQADVFYVYPTLNTENDDLRWNVPVEDIEQQNKVLNKAVLFQASAFATSGKLYVPYYRQAHLRSYKMLENGGDKALLLAYSDVKKAFEVYLKNYNKGRPIIIASHSQGSTHAKFLLRDFFDNKPLQEKLIAAYIVGTVLKSDLFSTLKPMTKPNEIGGFVGWNTFKKGNYPKKRDVYKGSVTTNPITWDDAKTTELYEHKGFLYSNKKIYKNVLKIEITDGLVWSTNPKFPMRFFMSFMKNYHVGDINLFWQDIRENAELRTKTWLAENK